MPVAKKILLTVSLFCITAILIAQPQNYPFWKDIQSFKKQDNLKFPPAGAILFIGSSSFTMWKDVQEYFPGYTIVNRGFGGSTLQDVIRYANDIIYPYNPRQIVIYCGENDLASSDSVTAQVVFERFKTLFSLIRKRFKKIPVVYVSMKPSPSRQHLLPQMLAGNVLIKNYLKKQKHATFVDVYHKMMKTDGTPLDGIFLNDKLHMNKKGYAIWQKEIQPVLIKD